MAPLDCGLRLETAGVKQIATIRRDLLRMHDWDLRTIVAKLEDWALCKPTIREAAVGYVA